VWNRDLSGYDPDGPLPGGEPDLNETNIVRDRVAMSADRTKKPAKWRALSEAKGLCSTLPDRLGLPPARSSETSGKAGIPST